MALTLEAPGSFESSFTAGRLSVTCDSTVRCGRPESKMDGFPTQSRVSPYNFRHSRAGNSENVILCACCVSFCIRPKGTDDVKRWDEQQEQSDDCWLDCFFAS